MHTYKITVSSPTKTIKNTIIFHVANTQEELLNSFSDFYQTRNADNWKHFIGPQIEMELSEGAFYEHHKSEIEPILHIHTSENKADTQTLCFTIPIKNEQEALAKLKTWATGSLYTLLHNESF